MTTDEGMKNKQLLKKARFCFDRHRYNKGRDLLIQAIATAYDPARCILRICVLYLQEQEYDAALLDNLAQAMDTTIGRGEEAVPSPSQMTINPTKEENMSDKISWLSDFDEAVKRAAKERKAILLDFFNPG